MGALAAGAVPRASCPKIMGKTRKKTWEKKQRHIILWLIIVRIAEN
jgi:hypothetical protein